MIIGIDANWAIYEQAGIGKYTYNLIKALVETDSENEYVLFCNFFRKFNERKKFVEKMVEHSQRPVKIEISILPSAWREWIFRTFIPAEWFLKTKVDIYHSPFFSGIPKNGFKNKVITIHDLVFLKFPEHRGNSLSHYYLKRTKTAVEKCQKIIAVSESTKKDLIDLLKVDENKIDVVLEGVDFQFKYIKNRKLVQNVLDKYELLDKEYILSVCTLEPRKNLIRLIKAYADLPNNLKEKCKLVLTGKKGWNNSELQSTILDLNLKDRIILTGFVSQEDLPAIYNGAICFCYPTLYEGFGLPPLEAMASGTPVITSNISSLPEVVGTVAKLIDPYKLDEISSALKEVLTSHELQNKMKLDGLKQAGQFTWQKVARETVGVYESLKLKAESEKQD